MTYDWKNYTILVAEDDPINYKYIHLLLEKRTGAQIVWAKDGLEAYEKIINFSAIDLVLLDLQLPELNGIDVLIHSKKIKPEMPVIMQTANTWNNEDEICIKAGCDGFFSKPLNIDKLFEHIDKCLKGIEERKLARQN